MEYTVSHDSLGTHLDWAHDGVTAKMLDWFWSNMEKCAILWHPEQHEPIEWPVPPRHGNPLGAVHNAPQTWDDGRRQNLFIRFEKFADLPAEVRDLIIYKHVIIVAGLGFEQESIEKAEPPMGYRVHQWEATDAGVVGKSSGIGARKKETAEDGKIWAAHAGQEVGNWEVFLPQLYSLYRVVTDTRRNPYTDLSVTGKGRDAFYTYIE